MRQDMSDLILAKTVADINREHTAVEHIFVRHQDLLAIHMVDRQVYLFSNKCKT